MKPSLGRSWQSHAGSLQSQQSLVSLILVDICLGHSLDSGNSMQKVLDPLIIHAATFTLSTILQYPLVLTSAYHCFQGELHVSKLFNHPNILPYRATFIADNELWVVTSFMAYGEWERGTGREGPKDSVVSWLMYCLPFLLPFPMFPQFFLQVLQRISSLHTSWMA